MKAVIKERDDVITREELARGVIGAFDEAVEIMSGRRHRPKTNWDRQFAEWDSLAEEVRNERGR